MNKLFFMVMAVTLPCTLLTSCGDDEEDIPSQDNQSYEYVDLGLSVKWATCNVGANSPEETGAFFTWGDTQPRRDSKSPGWGSYKWITEWSSAWGGYLTKYTSDILNAYQGKVDNKTVLDASDDAATTYMGKKWHTPTKAEIEEFVNRCKFSIAQLNGRNVFCATGPNGKSIYFPNDQDMEYWSSSIYIEDEYKAYYLTFGFGIDGELDVTLNDKKRDHCCAVRGVRK